MNDIDVETLIDDISTIISNYLKKSSTNSVIPSIYSRMNDLKTLLHISKCEEKGSRCFKTNSLVDSPNCWTDPNSNRCRKINSNGKDIEQRLRRYLNISKSVYQQNQPLYQLLLMFSSSYIIESFGHNRNLYYKFLISNSLYQLLTDISSRSRSSKLLSIIQRLDTLKQYSTKRERMSHLNFTDVLERANIQMTLTMTSKNKSSMKLSKRRGRSTTRSRTPNRRRSISRPRTPIRVRQPPIRTPIRRRPRVIRRPPQPPQPPQPNVIPSDLIRTNDLINDIHSLDNRIANNSILSNASTTGNWNLNVYDIQQLSSSLPSSLPMSSLPSSLPMSSLPSSLPMSSLPSSLPPSIPSSLPPSLPPSIPSSLPPSLPPSIPSSLPPSSDSYAIDIMQSPILDSNLSYMRSSNLPLLGYEQPINYDMSSSVGSLSSVPSRPLKHSRLSPPRSDHIAIDIPSDIPSSLGSFSSIPSRPLRPSRLSPPRSDHIAIDIPSDIPSSLGLFSSKPSRPLRPSRLSPPRSDHIAIDIPSDIPSSLGSFSSIPSRPLKPSRLSPPRSDHIAIDIPSDIPSSLGLFSSKPSRPLKHSRLSPPRSDHIAIDIPSDIPSSLGSLSSAPSRPFKPSRLSPPRSDHIAIDIPSDIPSSLGIHSLPREGRKGRKGRKGKKSDIYPLKFSLPENEESEPIAIDIPSSLGIHSLPREGKSDTYPINFSLPENEELEDIDVSQLRFEDEPSSSQSKSSYQQQSKYRRLLDRIANKNKKPQLRSNTNPIVRYMINKMLGDRPRRIKN